MSSASGFASAQQEAPEVLAEAERLGVLVPTGDGRFRAPSPSLLAIAEEVVARGISLRSALSILEEIDRHCESVSRSFVELFLHEIWKPFAQADMPAERWPEIEHAVERLGPVASEAVIAIFQRRLSADIEGAFRGDRAAAVRARHRTERRSRWAYPILTQSEPRCSSGGAGRRPGGTSGPAASASSGSRSRPGCSTTLGCSRGSECSSSPPGRARPGSSPPS